MSSKKVVSSPNFVKLLTRYKEYNVVGHIRPDGDCVGSQLAIANILEQLGIKCNVIKNSNVGRVLSRFFDGYELINNNEMNISLPLICVDCSDFRRTGDYISGNYKVMPYICIDHHTSNDRFAENNIINTSAAATAEIIADLMLQNGIKFNQKISNLLYLGIMTDTNRFAYETTTKNTLRIVEHLVDNGANLSSIYYDVYEHDSIERYRALEIFLKNICVFANGKCCISHLTFDDLENAGARHSDTEGFVNYARQLDGVDIGAFLEFNKDYINCSMRAKSPRFRIDIFAKKFGGGGHPAASGFTLKNFPKNFYEIFKLELANYVQSFYEHNDSER